MTLFLFPALVNADVVWTAHTNAGTRLWDSVAMSADGMRIIAAAQTAVVQSGGAIQHDPGYLYRSTNGGVSWSPLTQAESRVWSLITSSADGTQLAAIAHNGSTGYVVTSSDGGNTWINRQASGYRDWRALAYSRDGNTLVAAAFNDGLFISTDHGATWIPTVTSSHYWTDVALSSDGEVIAATVEDGPIQISRDGGVTWNDVETSRNWRGVTMSSDGGILAATESKSLGSNIYLSQDGGTTWTPAPTDPELSGWRDITSSSDGDTIIATNYYTQRAYASTDGGALWYELPGMTVPRPDSSIALTDAGDKIAVVGNDVNSSNPNLSIDRVLYIGVLTPFIPEEPTAPILTNIMAYDVDRVSARITWDSDVPATSNVVYGTTTGYGLQETSATEVANHTIYLYSLACGTTYHYQVSSSIQGTTTTSVDHIFETAPCLPPIDITDVTTANITTNAATIKWKTLVKADSTVEYGTTDEYGDLATKDVLTKKHAVRLTDLACETTYHFRVSSGADDATGTSGDYTFTTLPCPVPTISEIQVTRITKKAATIFWKTATPADSTIDFGTTPSHGQSISRETLQMQRSMNLTGLTCGTTYHFTVRSASAQGLEETGDADTFSTLSCN